jgi:hypothetical protein
MGMFHFCKELRLRLGLKPQPTISGVSRRLSRQAATVMDAINSRPRFALKAEYLFALTSAYVAHDGV